MRTRWQVHKARKEERRLSRRAQERTMVLRVLHQEAATDGRQFIAAHGMSITVRTPDEAEICPSGSHDAAALFLIRMAVRVRTQIRVFFPITAPE